LRDVPFNVSVFGDAWFRLLTHLTYLGYLAGQTTEIALGVSSIALPFTFIRTRSKISRNYRPII